MRRGSVGDKENSNSDLCIGYAALKAPATQPNERFSAKGGGLTKPGAMVIDSRAYGKRSVGVGAKHTIAHIVE